MDQHL
jgi:hypothetical protein